MKVQVAMTLGAAILGLSACMPNGPLVPVASSPHATSAASPSPVPVRTSPPPSPSPAPVGDRPIARAGAALTFDPVSGQLLLIGGMSDPLHPPESAVLPGQDFWGWTPISGWKRLTPDIVPTAGYLSAMAYDAAAGRTVLVSQSSQTVWTWDGKSWTPAGGGLQIDELGGADYDSQARVVRVLGRASSASQVETMWSWDGSTWGVDTTPMSARTEVVVAYDQANARLVVYGGGDPATWLFDGSTWTKVTTSAAPSYVQSSAAYDPTHGRVVMYSVAGETWTWDGSNWTIRSTGGPGIRRDESLAYDPAIGKVVLFGGKVPHGADEVYMNDLWAWDGARWSQLS
jgi:hypothetical protein